MGENFIIYPNPANDNIYISAENVRKVEIYNIMGDIVATYDNSKIVNIAALPVGSYVIRVLTNSGVVTEKINIIR